MRVFVVLASLVVLISADVKHLYDAPYKTHTVTHGSTGFADTVAPVTTTFQQFTKPASVVTTSQYVQPAVHTTVNRFGGDSVGTFPASTGFVSTSGSGSSFGSGSSYNSGFGSGGLVSSGFGGSSGSGFGGNYHDAGHDVKVSYRTTVVKQTAPLVSKSSYVFSAPEDNEDIQHDQTIVLPRPKQHYKVVFIKAPATTVVNTPSTAVGGQTQEKTLIYVVSDKKRIENHVEVPEIDQAKLQKPEVFFIKNNKPTEIVNSKIKYETVDSVHGAENGAVNGVANKVSGHAGQYQDEGSNSEQAHIAQSIFQAVKSGGLQSGVHTVDQLISAGHSVNYGGESFGSQGQFDTVSVQQPEKYYTGLAQPSHTTTTFVTEQKPASITYESGNSGSSYTEQGYNY